ncbi:SDR family oxidoreductase [Bacteroides sp. K03]|uniref:3-ketodihydrosphingosine reductase n=1 Tax=Bacteroides TaxID=816 RepID=UPI001C8B2680|nr:MULTISPECIES: SDR family oxidoreductase [Bacteroides]MBX9189110.1 SDR family oxidoreductase [Bacteroides sp. K03]
MKQPQVILITGASSGFGKITAQTLAAQGHIVYGTSRKQTENKKSVTMLVADVTDSNSIHHVVERIIKEHGRIDVLINNAGVGIGGALELATDEEIALQMDTNFLGMVRVCRSVLPIMRRQRKGKIINISSIAGLIAVPYQGFYSASKFAIEGYSEALSLEIHPFGIKVCVVEPGDFNTGFTANRNISATTLNNPDYGQYFADTLKIIEKAETGGCSPSKLATTILKLVEKENPPFRTLTGPLSQVGFAKVKGWLPGKIIRYALRTFYRIKKY